ncbi:response regulator [Arenibacter algicola]|uniref:response regulator n=1 Tax=Arenibacter algicola TaxID=616991 RepID=UPI00068DA7D5|nr:response regulator [Arenibacter algicola]
MTHKYKKLMIVDDNKIDIFITIKLLSKYCFAKDVLQYTSAEKALEYLKENNLNIENLPDLIFLDINMPIMDGFEFLDQFNKLDNNLHEHCKVCIVSSSISPHDVHKAKLERGISKFTSKPISKNFIESLMA